MRKTGKRLSVSLSDYDKQLLNSYCAFGSCLSSYLGTAYEIVIHSFGENDNFTLKAFNSNGRIAEEKKNRNAQGASIDKASDNARGAVEQLRERHKHGDDPIIIGFGIGVDGNTYKSASIGIVGSQSALIGMICINYNLDAPFSDILRNFAIPSYLDSTALPFPVSDNSRYDSSLTQTITKVRDNVMNDPTIPAKFKRKEIVRLLNELGVFKVKNAIQISADTLGITIATIYMHIRNLDTN